MDKKQGKLIVIDGIDGSGKTTQIELLKQYLASQGVSLQVSLQVEVIDFPRYEDNLYGKLIKRYLEGEFGGIENVNPYLMALAFAGDRFLAKPLIESWLQSGKLVIANRYVSASKAHLGANLSEEKREEFMEWIDKLEYQTNGLLKPDLNILLDIDPFIGQQNALAKNQPDIHEEDKSHLEKARKIYLELSQTEENWKIVECMEKGEMKLKEAIHKLIVEIFSSIL